MLTIAHGLPASRPLMTTECDFAVRSIYSLLGALGSVCGLNTGFPLHFSGARVACSWILGEWESCLSQCSLSQVSQHSTGQILSAMREELTQKMIVKKRSEKGRIWLEENGLWLFFFWIKRVARKWDERPNKSTIQSNSIQPKGLVKLRQNWLVRCVVQPHQKAKVFISVQNGYSHSHM